MRQQKKSESKACIRRARLCDHVALTQHNFYIYIYIYLGIGFLVTEQNKNIYICAKASGMRGEHRRGLVGGGYVDMYIYTHIYIYMYAGIHLYLQTYIYIFINIYRRACMQAHLYMYVQKE